MNWWLKEVREIEWWENDNKNVRKKNDNKNAEKRNNDKSVKKRE